MPALNQSATKHLTLTAIYWIGFRTGRTDTLILKDGSNFSGKFLDIIFGKIIFEIADKSIVKHPVKSVQNLSINTFMIISNGQWVALKEFVKYFEEKSIIKSMIITTPLGYRVNLTHLKLIIMS